jgi:hypothetical protein
MSPARHDRFLRDGIDTGIALQGTCGEFEQLAVKGRRHVLADLEQGLLHKEEIVQHPFGGM